jgi:hypothetical protein
VPGHRARFLGRQSSFRPGQARAERILNQVQRQAADGEPGSGCPGTENGIILFPTSLRDEVGCRPDVPNIALVALNPRIHSSVFPPLGMEQQDGASRHLGPTQREHERQGSRGGTLPAKPGRSLMDSAKTNYRS